MKVVLIDDEQLALNYLEHQLSTFSYIEVVGKFIDTSLALQHILSNTIDLVFLDIHMPEINGIEFAEKLLQHKPLLHIVFVTAFDNYAIKAFEINALDYVMKPVGVERLEKTLERIQTKSVQSNPGHELVGDLQVCLFQHFIIEAGGKLLSPIRWRTSKAQELFLYLLQHRGQYVRKAMLAELLWPDQESEKSYAQLYTAIYHIRKTISAYGNHFQIANTAEGYILNVQNVSIDVGDWERDIQHLNAPTHETISEYERLVKMYKGDYLQELEYWWAESERQRLKLLWFQISYEMAEWFADNGQTEKAIAAYQHICNRYPYSANANLALMMLYATTNNPTMVHRQYKLFTTMLSDELNEKPSSHIMKWYEHWCSAN